VRLGLDLADWSSRRSRQWRRIVGGRALHPGAIRMKREVVAGLEQAVHVGDNTAVVLCGKDLAEG
jgi:hypothetical protein